MTKGFLKIVGAEDTIPVLFNPTEYSLSNGMQYTEKSIPGRSHPIGQYIAGNSRTLNVSLYFDTYQPPDLDDFTERGLDVTFYTGKILALMTKNESQTTLPKVVFSWGSLNFEGILTDVKENYTMFLPDGTPVRAKLDITMKSVPQEAPSETDNASASEETQVVVVEGDTLCGIAEQNYGSSGYWRQIAVRNGILNPLSLKEGEVLILPPKQS